MRAITGQIETASVIFVEDEFAKTWVEAILRQSDRSVIEHFQVHAISGDGTAVAMNKYHNQNPAIVVPSICLIDGDSRQKEDNDLQVYRLPGDMPESYVFDSCLDNWPSIGGKLSVALLQRFEDSEKILDICKSVRISNKDSHLLYSQVGEAIGLIPEKTVASAFTTMWAQSHKDEVRNLIGKIAKTAKGLQLTLEA